MPEDPWPEDAPQPTADAPWQRLHPSSPLFSLLGMAKEALFIAVPLFFFGGEHWAWYLLIFAGGSVIADVLRYVVTRYRITAEGLVLRQGLFVRQVRVIPLDRIQNLDRVQGPVHRLFGVAELRIETASGNLPEARLRVLGDAALARLRTQLAARRGTTARHADEHGRTLFTCSTGELLKLGALSGRGLAMIAAAIGGTLQFADEAPLERLLPIIQAQLDQRSVLLVLVLGVGLLALLLSIGWTLLMLSRFRLSAHGSDLRIACGLVARFESTIPRRRIQFLSVQQGPLLRLVRRATVRVETAGAAQVAPLSRRWFVPIAPLPAIPPILAQVQDAVDFGEIDWQPLSPRVRRRLRRRTALLGLLLGVLALGFWPWLWLPPLTLLLGAVYGHLQGRAFAWSTQPGGMLVRSGVLRRRWSALPFACGQVLALRRSPIDRWLRMASLSVDSAGAGPARHQIAIPMLELQLALRLQRDWRTAIAGRAFQW